MIGQVVGNYRIVSELGKGGMGMVYRAEHTQLGRLAALKMLLPQFSSDPAIVQRFFNEARAASAIEHPGIVLVHDFGTHTDGGAYIVMELLKGESLQQRLARGPIAPLEGAALVSQVLGALSAAHARGIVHRDLKPDNIFLVPNELMPGGIQVKLLDFGIAKLANDGGSGTGMKTQTGMMMGTPAYMSPEQCMGRSDLDHRTDLYAIGCILYHLLTGRPPFLSDQGTGMMIAMHIRDVPPHPRSLDPTIPEGLSAIVMRLLEKEPAARYQTAAEVRDALTALGAGAPSRPPQPFDQYGATIAPTSQLTTASGAAAQMMSGYGSSPPQMAAGYGSAPPQMGVHGSAPPHMPATTQPPARGRGGVIIGGALVIAAIAGAGVFVAMRGKGAPSAAAHTADTNAAARPEVPADTKAAKPDPTAPAGKPVEPAKGDGPELTVASANAEPCPLGQMRGLDTHDHCCWPDQAWSSAKNKCVGAPKCPDGHKASGEECLVIVADSAVVPSGRPLPVPPSPPDGDRVPVSTRPPMPGQPPSPPLPSGPAPTFTLSAKTIAPNTKLEIKFASPVSSAPNNRSWITIVEAQKPPNQYGNWTYIADGATTAELVTPTQEGAYEVRLHTDYPRLSTNVRRTVPVTIKEGAIPKTSANTGRNEQRFMLASQTARVGEQVEITFPVAMKAASGEKFWVTVVKQGAADTSWGAYEYVPDAARTMQVEMPKEAGDYEIRLHANYPRLTTNLVHRAPIRVED